VRLPLLFQVAGGTECQVHAFVEVVAGFAIAAYDVLSHMGFQEIAGLVEKGLIAVGERDS
jgi:hypothetical protein